MTYSDWWIPFDIGVVQGLILACAVLGFSVALRILQFPDLTIEASLLLGGATYGAIASSGKPIWISFLLATVAGVLAGGTTGILHTRLRLNKFLAGILVIAASYSIALRFMGGSNIGLLDTPNPLEYVQSLNARGPRGSHFGDALALASIVITADLGMIQLLRSRRGMRLRAVGCNPNHARALDINSSSYLIVGLAIVNALGALSGALLAMYQGFADVGMGQGTLITALASLAIGERLTSRLHWPDYISVAIAAIVGSIIYQSVTSIAIRLGLPASDLKLVTAILVLIVVTVGVKGNYDLLTDHNP